MATATTTARVLACTPVDGARGWSAIIPFAEPRPKGNSKRIVSFGKRCPKCNRGRPSIQSTKADVANEKILVLVLASVAPPVPFEIPCVLHASIVLPIRPSWNAAKRRAAEEHRHQPCSAKGATGPIPDLGNLIKLLEDALEKGGWVANDSLITKHRTEKVYGLEPGYTITLRELPTREQ